MQKILAQLLILEILFIGGCTTLKYPPPPSLEVYALPPAETGLIAKVAGRFTVSHKAGQSGLLSLSDNQAALKWRLALVDEATQSIDVQYFIWQGDTSGLLLLDRLLKAADRGVLVRMLVDDLTFKGKDLNIAAIARHPHFDIKLFNPGKVRKGSLGKIGEWLLYFREMNRRMHNKLFIVDNRVAVVGGRNIGNEYFGLADKYNFRDLDALMVGAVVEEISHSFDDYWNAEISYPGSALTDKATGDDLNAIKNNLAAFLTENGDRLASYRLDPLQVQAMIRGLPSAVATGEAHFIQDEPITFGGEEHRLLDMLDFISRPTQSEIIFVTPYLIPLNDMLDNLRSTVSSGVKVTILTGSMGANNHTMTHSHYKKYRRPILDTGAKLFEFRHDPSQNVRNLSDVPPVRADFISLHIKAIVADRERCFVGSLNLDPRALEINTENGLYIESNGFCGKLAAEFETLMQPDNAWRVYLNDNDKLRWESSEGVVSIQPARGFWQRVSDFFFRLLPIEKQL